MVNFISFVQTKTKKKEKNFVFIEKAARLMMNYPGVVSCDDETYHKAHLEERYFELLPSVPLKGLTVSTCMRRYKGQDDGETNDFSLLVLFDCVDKF